MAAPTPRQRTRTIAFAAAALVVAGITAWLIYMVMAEYQRQLAEAKSGPRLVEVVTAANELLPGRPIAEGDLVTAQMPEGSFPTEGVYAPDTIKEIYGQTPAERILPGEVLRRERLDTFAARAALDRIIAPGARAVTVLAERAAGVGGLLMPADQVDVIVTIRPDTNALGADWVTETILQNVRVLAVDQDVIGGAPEEPAEGSEKKAKPKETNRQNRKILVTLEVMPDEAEKLALSTSRGDLHLTLRGAQDEEILVDRGPLVTNALVGLSSFGASDVTATKRKEVQKRAHARPKAGAAEQTPASTTEVIQGGTTTTEKYDEKGNKIEEKKRGGR